MTFWKKNRFLFSSILPVLLVFLSLITGGCSYTLVRKKGTTTNALSTYEYYIKGREAYLLFTPKGFEEAIRFYNKALVVDGSYALAYSGLGEAYSLLGRWKETNREEYKGYYDKSLYYSLRALELAPNQGESHRALALNYMNLMRLKEAEKEAKYAIELNPNDAEAYCILWMATGNATDSEYIKKALKLDPNLIMAHYWLAKEYYYKGNYDMAICHFNRSVEINPNLFIGHYNLGVIYDELGMDEEAIQKYKRAIEIDSTFMFARINLGIVLARVGKIEEAIQEYKKVIEINPNFVEVYFELGIIFESVGKVKEAIEYYRRFIELAPSQYRIFIDIARYRIYELESSI